MSVYNRINLAVLLLFVVLMVSGSAFCAVPVQAQVESGEFVQASLDNPLYPTYPAKLVRTMAFIGSDFSISDMGDPNEKLAWVINLEKDQMDWTYLFDSDDSPAIELDCNIRALLDDFPKLAIDNDEEEDIMELVPISTSWMTINNETVKKEIRKVAVKTGQIMIANGIDTDDDSSLVGKSIVVEYLFDNTAKVSVIDKDVIVTQILPVGFLPGLKGLRDRYGFTGMIIKSDGAEIYQISGFVKYNEKLAKILAALWSFRDAFKDMTDTQKSYEIQKFIVQFVK